jgi:uncharacterized membrane protein
MATSTSKLIALVFDDPYKADEAHAALKRLAGEGLLETDETAVIVRTADGKTTASQAENVVKKDRKIGHVVGLVAAAVTGTVPLIMAATVAGALIGKITDHGITNKFVKQVQDELQPGTSALVVLGRSDPERRQKVIDGLKKFNPKVLSSDLPLELEYELQQALRSTTVIEA